MADFDLRALAAPLEALQPKVKAAYARLDSQWEQITSKLKQLSIPRPVCYVFSEDPECPPNCTALEFVRWKGEKRICIVTYSMQNTPYGPDEVREVTPYEEWGGEQRIDMLQHVPGLFKKAVEVTKQFIEQVPE